MPALAPVTSATGANLKMEDLLMARVACLDDALNGSSASGVDQRLATGRVSTRRQRKAVASASTT